ncbi:MAG: hypothetical protein KAU31_14230 [Spirochaetaceae bacterium]|nr:hypothetical protein [Spirochaetaceae bacterium]
MKTTTTVGISMLLLISAATLSAQADTDAVWAQAVSTMSESGRWVAGQTEMTIETLARNGDVDQRFSILQTTTPGEEGLLVAMTPLAMPAGGPGGMFGGMRPSGAQPPADGAPPEGGFPPGGRLPGGMADAMSAPRDSAGANPFAADTEDTVQVAPLGSSRAIGGVRSEAFSIEWEAPDGTVFDGEIWIAVDSGAPVRLEVTGDSPESDIRLLEITTVYEHLGETSVPSRMVIFQTVRSGLFSSTTTRITMSYADYFETDGLLEYIFQGFPRQEE